MNSYKRLTALKQRRVSTGIWEVQVRNKLKSNALLETAKPT